MINRRSLFRTAHATARRERGMYGMVQTYRAAFGIALRRLYAQAKEMLARAARMEAFRATMERQTRITDLKGIIRDLEHMDRLGVAGLARLRAANDELHRLQRAA